MSRKDVAFFDIVMSEPKDKIDQIDNADNRNHNRNSGSVSFSALFAPLCRVLQIGWGFIESDFLTFAVPNTVFGIIGALASSRLLEGPAPELVDVLRRAPFVLFFNFYSLLLFDLANQYTVESVEEDRINKPWRPIPSGLITPKQTRSAMLVIAPVSLGFNYMLGVWNEGLLVQVLSYYYNELNGSGGLVRDLIISISYGLANYTSLQLAIGPENTVSAQGKLWTVIVSAIILTTMHVQDFKDQVGDAKLGRKTMPLFLGDGFCRVLLSFFIPCWSLIAIRFWRLAMIGSSFYCLLAAWIVARLLRMREQKQDARTWRWWCFWHASLYALPLLGGD